MRFGIAPWVNDALGRWRPNVENGTTPWEQIDLRPDGSGSGWCIVYGEPPSSGTFIDLGDSADSPSAALVSAIESRFGVTLGLSGTQRTLRRVMQKMLMEIGDDANPARWKRLRAVRGMYEINLGPLQDRIPVISGGMTALHETFDGADGTTPASVYTGTEVIGDWVRSGNALTCSTSGFVFYRLEAALASSDHWAEALISSDGSDKSSYVCARFAAGASTCYFSDFNAGRDINAMYKMIAGTGGISQIRGEQTVTIGTSYTQRTQAEASTIKAFLGGVEVASVTDPSIPTGTLIGAGGFSLGGFLKFNDLDGSDIAAVTGGRSWAGVRPRGLMRGRA